MLDLMIHILLWENCLIKLLRIIMAIRSDHVVIIVPIWVDHEMQQEYAQGALLHFHIVICLDIGVKHVHI